MREDVLQALPGYDAVLITAHHNVNTEFLNIAGKQTKKHFVMRSIIIIGNMNIIEHDKFLILILSLIT